MERVCACALDSLVGGGWVAAARPTRIHTHTTTYNVIYIYSDEYDDDVDMGTRANNVKRNMQMTSIAHAASSKFFILPK